MLEIIKSTHKYQPVYGYDLPKKEFDWWKSLINPEEYEFVLYRGNYYLVANFMEIRGNVDLKDWDGYQSDTFFSGVLIKWDNENDCYRMATYYSD